MLKEREKLIPGTKVELCGEQHTVPPLTLGQVRRLSPTLAKVATFSAANATAIPEEVLDAILDVAHAALSRNYDCTKDDVADLVDVATAPTLILAVMGVSGLNKKDGASGEA